MMMVTLHEFLAQLFSVFIQFRFMNHLLHRRYAAAPTFLILFLYSSLQAYININLSLYQLFPQQLFYLACQLLSILVLYQGNPAKKILTSILMTGIGYTSNFLFLPLTVYIGFAVSPEHSQWIFLLCTDLSLLASMAIYESIRRKFKALRGDMTAGCCLYLLCMSVFITHAVITFTEQRLELVRTRLDMALYCTAYSIAGIAFILLSIYYIDQKLSLALMEQQNAITARHIHSIKETEKQTAAFRHDMKNHMICLNNLLKEGYVSQARGYLEAVNHTLDTLAGQISTGNVYADAIIREKCALAAAHSIPFSVDMLFPDTDDLPPMDLIIIISNALDNALEACIQITDPAAPRFIRAVSYIRRSCCLIEIENSAKSFAVWNQGPIKTTKADHVHHGIGLLNIEEAVKRCQGTMEISCSQDVFHFCAMLPIRGLAPP